MKRIRLIALCAILSLLVSAACSTTGRQPAADQFADPSRENLLEQDNEQALDLTLSHDPAAMSGNQYASELVGDIINFGGNDWIVLDIQDGRALILSEKLITHRPYHETFEDVTWAASDTRRWLNDSYYNSFSSSDRELIAETTLTNEDNQWFGTAGGGPTTDRIFLLSLDEVVKYFGDSGQLQNRPSEDTWYILDGYNDARKATCAIDKCVVCANESSWYWGLRSPGWLQNCAAGISLDGRLCVDGGSVSFERPGIRPAMWLKL